MAKRTQNQLAAHPPAPSPGVGDKAPGGWATATPCFALGSCERRAAWSRNVPKTTCVLTPSTPFVCLQGERGLTPTWAGPQLHALAPKRCCDGRMGDVVAGAKPGE